jgi:hypothetical protein
MPKHEIRTRFLTKLTNSEVEDYLSGNDIIVVPVGTVEMHGGLPLDCETVISEAFALRMACEVDGLVLPHLPYFLPERPFQAQAAVPFRLAYEWASTLCRKSQNRSLGKASDAKFTSASMVLRI